MVFYCKGFYFDEENQEASGKSSAEKRAEELPGDEKSSSRAKRVVPVPNPNTLSRHQTEYDGANDQSKKTFKAINDLGGVNSKNSSRRSRVAPEESFEEQKPQYFEQFYPQPPGSHRSDSKKPKEKTDNPSAEKFLDEDVLLRILHCNCDSWKRVICEAARKFKGVSAVSADTSTDLVRVTGKMDVKELLIHLKKKSKKIVEVVPSEIANYPEKDREYDRDTNILVDNLSSKSRVKEKVKPAKLEEKLGQQNSENSELSLAQLEVNHGSDFMEPHQKIENSGNRKTQKEHSSPLLLGVRMRCSCEGCAKKTKDIFKKCKGVDTVKIHRDKDLVEVTGTMDTDELVVYLEEKLRRSVEVMPIQNNENGASPTQKHGAGVRHIANITDNASRKKDIHPDVQKLEKRNLEKIELTFPPPRRRDRNYNKKTGMVLLKIGMYCLEGCIPQTRNTIMNFPGVKSVKVDESKGLVIVDGAPNVKELVDYLEKKLKRSVEVVLAPNENVTGDNKEVEVTKTETLKEPSAACKDGRNKDVEIKKEFKKEAKEIQIKQKVKDAKVENKKYSLHDGGTKEEKEDKKGNERGEDKVKETEGHGCIPYVGEKHKELEREADRQTGYQRDYLRYGLSNCYNESGYHDCGTHMFSDENPHSCTIM